MDGPSLISTAPEIPVVVFRGARLVVVPGRADLAGIPNAVMLMGGYVIAATGPFVLGAARDLTGDFAASLWLLVLVALGQVLGCLLLSPSRLRRGIGRSPVLSSAP